MDSVVITIAGGSGSGKSTLVRRLFERLPDLVEVIELDWYYRDQRELSLVDRGKVNYDHPDAIEFELLRQHLQSLLTGRPIFAPQYDFANHSRSQTLLKHIRPRKIIVVEGIFALWSDLLNEIASIRIFIDTPAEIRFERRLRRDTIDRGRSRESVIRQWVETVEPMFNHYYDLSISRADLRISGESFDEQPLAELERRITELDIRAVENNH